MDKTLLEYGDEFYEENEVPKGLSPYAVRTSWMETTVNEEGTVFEMLHTDEISVILETMEV